MNVKNIFPGRWVGRRPPQCWQSVKLHASWGTEFNSAPRTHTNLSLMNNRLQQKHNVTSFIYSCRIKSKMMNLKRRIFLFHSAIYFIQKISAGVSGGDKIIQICHMTGEIELVQMRVRLLFFFPNPPSGSGAVSCAGERRWSPKCRETCTNVFQTLSPFAYDDDALSP